MDTRRSRESVVQGGSASHGTAASPDAIVPHAGFFASHAEKAYRDGVVAYLGRDFRRCIDAMSVVLAHEPAMISARLFAGFAADALDDEPLAITHLEAVVRSDEALPDAFEAKYLPGDAISLALTVQLTDALTAEVPFSQFGAALTLAQLYRDAGRPTDGVAILRNLRAGGSQDLVRLALADLLLSAGDPDAVVQLTNGVANDSNADVELLHLRGRAFVAQGLPAAAADSFRDALAKTADRDPQLLLAVRYDRASSLEDQGQRARARADFERIIAVDPGYADARARLDALR